MFLPSWGTEMIGQKYEYSFHVTAKLGFHTIVMLAHILIQISHIFHIFVIITK